MDPTSNLGVFVTLYTCHPKINFLDSDRLQVFKRPASIWNKPGPLKAFRGPASPGKGGRKSLAAAGPSLKTFGRPFTKKLPVLGKEPVGTTGCVNCQFVAHKVPGRIENGKPLDQR